MVEGFCRGETLARLGHDGDVRGRRDLPEGVDWGFSLSIYRLRVKTLDPRIGRRHSGVVLFLKTSYWSPQHEAL
jgi:hypothetical protein